MWETRFVRHQEDCTAVGLAPHASCSKAPGGTDQLSPGLEMRTILTAPRGTRWGGGDASPHRFPASRLHASMGSLSGERPEALHNCEEMIHNIPSAVGTDRQSADEDATPSYRGPRAAPICFVPQAWQLPAVGAVVQCRCAQGPTSLRRAPLVHPHPEPCFLASPPRVPQV